MSDAVPPTCAPPGVSPADSPSAADCERWRDVAAFLGRAETHGMATAPIRVDTHAAVVFLADRLAYKIKRPVRFPYLDFSTLPAREEACRREIAIDRPIAPQIYRRTVAITREADGRMAIGGGGEVVEWAVEMNRFDETATLDRVLQAGPLPGPFVDDLAAEVARAQVRARIVAAAPWIDDLGHYLDQNVEAFAGRPDLFPPDAAAALDRRARGRLADLQELLKARGRLGFVRLGHGDLHTGNIAVIDGKAQPFDAIEFDDAIATGDLLYDAGFLVMDLIDRGDRAAACRFLGRLRLETAYLEATQGVARGRPATPEVIAECFLGQIDGLVALPLFLSIRASLRAKIAAARALHLTGAAQVVAEAEARRLFGAAMAHLDPHVPRLVAIGGVSGSGKSTLSLGLAPQLAPEPGAIVLRSDEIRKLLAGVTPTTRLGPEDYSAEATARVYSVLERATVRALGAGRSVIIDAVSLRPEERDRFAAIALRAEVPFTGLWLEVSDAVALARVGARQADASDADAAVIAFQRSLDQGRIGWIRLDADGAAETILAVAVKAVGAPN